MATYATQAQLIERFHDEASLAKLTEATATTVTEATITRILNQAQGMVDSYIGARLAVPVDVGAHTAAAPILRDLTLDLAVHAVHLLRPSVPEDVTKARDDAIAWLDKFVAGKAVLPAEVAPEPTVLDEPSGSFAFARGGDSDYSGPQDMI
jgi:phage gp36-like protein